MKWFAYHRKVHDGTEAMVAMDNNDDIRDERFADNGGAETAAGAGSKEGVSDKEIGRAHV